jgi:hypothetical protein
MPSMLICAVILSPGVTLIANSTGRAGTGMTSLHAE